MSLGELEFVLPSLGVSDSSTPLLILGNDVLAENERFRFLGISNSGDKPQLQFLIKATSRLATVPCSASPSGLA